MGQMVVKKLISGLLIFQLGLSLIFATPEVLNAFDAKVTHRGTEDKPGLTMKAIDLKLKEHNPNDPNAPMPDPEFYNTFSNPDIRELIERGSEEEDYPEPVPWWMLSPHPAVGGTALWWKFANDFFGKRSLPWTTPWSLYPVTPFNTHFYNPHDPGKNKGLFSLPSSNAPWYADNYLKHAAGSYLGTNCQPQNIPEAFYVLGRSLHIIEDMATPAHVIKDIHLPWVSPDKFERYVKDEVNISNINVTHSIPSLNPAEDLARETFEEVTYTEEELRRRYGDRFEPYVITTDPLSLFSPGTTLSGVIEGIGLKNYDWWEVGTDEDGEPLYYIENADGELCQEWAEKLLPKAIAYSAGAINKFWDIVKHRRIEETSNPGCDHPDDNNSVASPEVEAMTWELERMLFSYLRLAIKKNKSSLLSYQKLLDEYKKYLELAQTGTTETLKVQKVRLREHQFALDENSLQLEADFNTLPDVALLNEGFYDSLRAMALRMGEPLKEIDENFSPSDLKENPILIIPSGGLYGLEKSELFKAKLAEYVKNGGTVVCLAQQHGYEFKALPGSENLSAYGWREDQSCQTKAVFIDTYHQLLSGLGSSSVSNVSVDGYFTSWPENSTILLRRTKNGMPALITYSYGKGKVIVGTIYSDWAYSMNQASEEEQALIRDIISWAKTATDIPQFKQGDEVGITEVVKNITDTTATAFKLTLLNPDKNTIEETTISALLSPGSTLAYPYTYNTTEGAKPGIYYVDYTLLDEEGNIVQPQAEGERFCISNPPIETYIPTEDYQIWVTSPVDEVAKGSEVPFTIHIKNNTGIDLLNAKIGIASHEAHQEGGRSWVYKTTLENIDVYAHSEATFLYTQKVDISQSINFALYPEGKEPDTSWNMKGSIARAEKGIWVTEPAVKVTFSSSEPFYSKETTASLKVNLKNLKNVPYPASVKLTILDSANAPVFEKLVELNLQARESTTQTVEFFIPSQAKGGMALALAEVTSNGEKVGFGATTFEVAKTILSITPQVPDFLGNSNEVIFKIKNEGFQDSDLTTLSVSFISPQGNLVASEERSFSVARGEEKLIAFNLPLPSQLEFGEYKISYKLIFPDGLRANEVSVPCGVEINSHFDKPFYRIRDKVNLNIEVKNTGRFIFTNANYEISIPTFSVSDSKTLSLNPRESTTFPYSISLSEDLPSAQYEGSARFVISSGSSFARFSFSIPKPKLSLSLSQEVFLSPGNLSFTLSNEGGVDTTYTAEVRLEDLKTEEFLKETLAGKLKAGEATEVSLSLPAGLVSDTYLLFLKATLGKTGEVQTFFMPLTIKGLQANLSLASSKEIYSPEETATANVSLSNLESPFEGNLNLKVLSTHPSEITFEKAWGSYDELPNLKDFIFDLEGRILLVDALGQVKKYSPLGTPIKRWANPGAPDDSLVQSPTGIAYDSQGFIYVSDAGRNEVIKFNAEGNFILSFGGYGTEEGKLNNPVAIAVGSNNRVYVADKENSRISVFDENGNFLFSWGTEGAAQGEFLNLKDLVVDSSGNVYTLDQKHRIQKFDADGNFIASWLPNLDSTFLNYYTSYHLSLDDTQGILYVDSSGDFYRYIWKCNKNGDFLGRWEAVAERKEVRGKGIEVDESGNVYLFSKPYLYIFTSSGTYQSKLFLGTFPYGFTSPERIAVGKDGNVVVADTSSLEIKQFDTSGNFLNGWKIEPPLTDFALDYEGNVYVLRDWQVQKFDTAGKLLENISLSKPSYPQYYWTNSIAVDGEGNFYVGTSYSLASSADIIRKYDKYGNYIETFGGDLNVPYDIEIDVLGNVYICDHYNGRIVKYSSEGEFIKEFIGLDHPWSVAVDAEGNVYTTESWFTWKTYVKKFDAEGNLVAQFGSYGSGEGSFSGRFRVGVDRWGNIFIADAGNHRLQKFTQRSFGVVWEKDKAVSLETSETTSFIEAIGMLKPGKYYLLGTLTSSSSQEVAQSVYPFYVFEGKIIFTLIPDKKVYKVGDLVTVSVEVKNNSNTTVTDEPLTLYRDEEVLLNTPLTLPPGETYLTSVSFLAQSNFILKGSFKGVDIFEEREVFPPQVKAELTLPQVVGKEPFNVDLLLVNIGKVDANLRVNLSSGAVSEEVDISVPAGEQRLYRKTLTLTEDTTLTLDISGDLVQNFERPIQMGEKVNLTLDVQDIYPQGEIKVPYSLENKGVLESTFDLTATLGGEIISQRFFLKPGERKDEAFYFNLSSGDYTLKVSTPFESKEVSFKVRGKDKLSLTPLVVTSETTSFPDVLEGKIAIWAGVKNEGYNDFSGTLEIETNFFERETTLSVKASESGRAWFILNTEAASPGTYQARLLAKNLDGKVLAEKTFEIEVKAPSFKLLSIPSDITFTLGEEENFNFTLKNEGNLEGKARLALDIPGLFAGEKEFYLKAGETTEVSFSVVLPDDLEEKAYPATVYLNGEATEFKYGLQGIKVSVDASLDKEIYEVGDTAYLTLNIQNESTSSSYNLVARAKTNGYEVEKEFALVGNSSLTLELPVTEKGERLVNYGIYAKSGRAIYLNTLYLRARQEGVTLYTNKQLYQPGEVVRVTVESSEEGTLTVIGNDFIKEIYISSITETTSFSFNLAPKLKSGTYTLDYSLGSYSGTAYFDVDGMRARVLEAKLDKSSFNPVDNFKLNLKVELSQDLNVILRGWVYDPLDNWEKVFEEERSLNQGENLISLKGNFETTQSGMHRLVYGIYEKETDILIGAGEENFDINALTLVSLSTDCIDYPSPEEVVTAEVSIFGKGNGYLELYLDDELITSETVSAQGFKSLTYTLPQVESGMHILKAVLKDGVRSERACEFLVRSNLGLISGYAFRDSNANGVWDSTERPISGREIILRGTNISGETVEVTATTDGNGYYEFAGLLPGDYTVEEVLPSLQTTHEGRVIEPGWHETTFPAPFYLNAGEERENQNFGNIEYGWIYGRVTDEYTKEPYGNVAITLLETSRTTYTDSNGYFYFYTLIPNNTGLFSGTEYTVGMILPENYKTHDGVTKFSPVYEGTETVVNFTVYPASWSTGTVPHSIGYWKNWKNHYSEEEMQNLLNLAKLSSGLFADLTVSDVRPFLSFGKKTTMFHKAEAQLLASWLNITSSNLGVDTEVDLVSIEGWSIVVSINGDSTTITVDNLLNQIEAYFSPEVIEDTAKETWEVIKNILDALNNRLLF